MDKNFDDWNALKKKTEIKRQLLDISEREIWWISFGLNVGVEIDGKHQDYERPAIIIRKFNQHMVWVLPTTSQAKNQKFHEKFSFGDKIYFAALTQIRTMSTKRFLRKAGMVPRADFEKIKKRVVEFLYTNEDPH